MAKSNNDAAVETQQKFDFYFLGLVFTVLALSVQTAKFNSVYKDSPVIAMLVTYQDRTASL